MHSERRLFVFLWHYLSVGQHTTKYFVSTKLWSDAPLSQPQVFHGVGRVTLTERIQHVAKQPPWRTKNARLACMYELNVDVVVVYQSILSYSALWWSNHPELLRGRGQRRRLRACIAGLLMGSWLIWAWSHTSVVNFGFGERAWRTDNEISLCFKETDLPWLGTDIKIHPRKKRAHSMPFGASFKVARRATWVLLPFPCHGERTVVQFVSGELAFTRTSQSWLSPRSCRTSQGSMTSGNWERGYWWREYNGEGPTACQDAQHFLNYCRKKRVVVRKKGSSLAHCVCTFVQERTLQIGAWAEKDQALKMKQSRRCRRGVTMK